MRAVTEYTNAQRQDHLEAPWAQIMSNHEVSQGPKMRDIFASTEGGCVDAVAQEIGDTLSGSIPTSYESPAAPPKSDRSGTLGPRPVVGQFASTEWRLLYAKQDASIAKALDLLVRLRGGRTTMVEREPATRLEAQSFVENELAGVRAVCIAGCGLSWELQRVLQLRGLLVGRLPFTSSESASSFAERLCDGQLNTRERRRDDVNAVPLARRVHLQRSTRDGFTDALARLLPVPLDKELQENKFVASDGGSAEGACGVVLMSHGGVGPQLGEPIVDASARTSVAKAIALGATVFHLGCNGAGTSRVDPSLAVAQALDLRVDSRTTNVDAFSKFAERSLVGGSNALIAHVGTTWSNAFDDPTPLCDAVAWVVTGCGTAGHALSLLTNAANQSARDAFCALDAGDRVSAGLDWLRHLDLSHFVLLGDPSWSRSTGA